MIKKAKQTIKQVVHTILFSMVCVCVNGQNFSPQNGSVTQWNGEPLAVFEVATDNTDITNVTIGLKKKPLDKLVGFMEKYGKKAKEWARTAKREGVKDYEKNLYGTTAMSPFVDAERVGFVVGGESYTKDYSNTFMSQDTQTLGYPVFVVNGEGDCFMYLASGVNTLKVSTGRSVQTTTTVNSSTLLNPQTAVGHSTSQEMISYDLGWVKLWISVADVDAFIQHLKQLSSDFDNKKANKKATDKLFK